MSDQSSPVIYTLDIGGTNTRVGIFHKNTMEQTGMVRTPQGVQWGDDDPSAVKEVLISLVESTSKEHPPMDALAVSVTGMLRMVSKPGARSYGPFRDQELVLASPNISGLKNLPFMALLESCGWNVPIHVENDANAALRSAVAYPTALSINMGTGVGAALKRGNRIHHFDDYWSCYEIGHGFRWTFPEKLTLKCKCGATGCLEAAIGARALRGRYGVAPENAKVEIYEKMRSEVIEYLAPAIADTANKFHFDTVLLSGRTILSFNTSYDLVAALKQQIRDSRPSLPVPHMDIIDLPDVASMHGAALSLFDYEVISPKS